MNGCLVRPLASGQGRTYWKRRFLDALVLTVYELRNFKLFVKNKATGNASWRCSYYTNHWNWTAKGVSFCQWVLLYTYLSWGCSALLVSTNRAMRRPIHCGTSDRSWLHVSFSVWDKNINVKLRLLESWPCNGANKASKNWLLNSSPITNVQDNVG